MSHRWLGIVLGALFGLLSGATARAAVTPTITWGNPGGIAYGTPLGATQLNATASVPGTFVYTPAAGTVLTAGVWTLHTDFTPTDTVNYNPTSKEVLIKINKVQATINWSNPVGIAYGTPLGAVQLNAIPSVPGTFEYTPPAGTILDAGTQTLHVDFTPTDTINYNGRSKDVQIVVSKLTPTMSWNNPAGIVYGTALGGTQLNATASVPGTFAYAPAAGTIINTGAQTLHVEFTPTSPNYNPLSRDVSITVSKATPIITWANPAGIGYGMVLGAEQLNATANAAGTFVYSPAAGMVLGVGTHALHVDFTPGDPANYAGASGDAQIVVSQSAPTITWSDPAGIVYGTALGATQLNATASVAGAFAYTPAAGTVLAAGNRTLHVDFTPTDPNYSSASKDVAIAVSKATPVITWANPANITYGTALGATQLNATASVAGTFVYTPAAGTVPGVGTQTLHVDFTPSDAANHNGAAKDVQIVVSQTAPTITWNDPAGIVYGTALTATQLNATADVAGMFVYTPAASTVLNAGTYALHVEFTPTDPSYSSASKDVAITVSKATPVITWANPANISYGTALGATQLNATASVAGAFVYTPVAGTVPGVGTQTLHVEFTPGDAVNYNGAAKDVQIVVSQTAPTITWNDPAGIVYGTALTAAQLNATASVPGAFVYTPAAGTVLAVGNRTLHVDFTPTDPSYSSASKDVAITVSKATPVITWANPANISYGTALGATQLNATASVAGAFVYTPVAGTVPGVGTQTLHVEFTPGDAVNYNGAAKDVQIVVSQTAPTITWNDPAGIVYGTALGAAQLNATASVPGAFVYTPAAGTVLAVGNRTLHVDFTPTDPSYSSASKDVAITVGKASSIITWSNPANIGSGTPLGAAQLNATANTGGTFVYSPPAGTALSMGAHTLHVDFTPSDAANYNGASKDVQIVVSQPAPTITWSNPGGIAYGTPLGATQLNATASVPGTSVYTPAAGTVLTAGIWTLRVDFTPNDTANYSATSKEVLIKINKVTSTINWSNPAGIAYGTPLGATQLNAIPSVPGTFVYTPPAGTILNAGTQTLHVDFTPTDEVNYNGRSRDVVIVVAKATPTMTWSNPAGIAFGTPLGAAQLNATASTAGAFVYAPAAGTILNTGTHPLHVDFVPADAVNYNPTSKDAQIVVSKAMPAITWSAPPSIQYGTALNATQLNATANTAGAFAYSPTVGTVLNIGTHTLQADFAPVDTTNYNSASQGVQLVVTKVMPAITWGNPASIAYGTPLGAAQLNATAGVPGTFAYTPAAGTVLNAGTRTLQVVFTPSDTATYEATSKNVQIVVSPLETTVTWSNPAGIPYGTPLGATELGATAAMPGTFVYTPSAGTTLDAGIWTLHVDFTPTDTNYAVTGKDVLIKINKVTSTINWSNPTGITYGTALGAAQLDAMGSVPGTMVYTPPAGTILNAGTQTLHADFTPTDEVNYNGRSRDVVIVVAKATPTITWASPAISNGTALTAEHLNATANVAGTFVYTPPAGTIINSGIQTLHVDFTPNDTTNYNLASKNVPVSTPLITTTITWSNPGGIAYGTPLGATQLNATASVPGTFVYTPAAGTVLTAGIWTLRVDFTPTDTSYSSVSKEVLIKINKVTSTINWSNPAGIAYGTPLGAVQLNAMGSVPGTLVYTPPAGTVLNAGTQTLHVDFTPTDTVNYNERSRDVQIVVSKLTPTMTWGNPVGTTYGTALGATQLNATASVPGTFVYTPPAGTLVNAGTQTLHVDFTPTNPNYNSLSKDVSITVSKATPIITWVPPANIVDGIPLGTLQLNAAANAPGSIVYTPALGTVLPPGTHSLQASFTASDAGNYNPASKSVPLTVEVLPATILSYPENQTVAIGQTAAFSAQAAGTYPLSYQWQRRARGESLAQDIPGATSPDYVTPPATAADQAAEYSIRVQDTQGNSVLGSAMLTVTPTSPAVYYIDYAFGDDDNDGTSKSSPWRHAPDMNGCSDLCLITSVHPGDQFIFKGGITWDAWAFPMQITRGGTTNQRLYYGVDKTWFAGPAWSRPRFDLSGATLTEPPVKISSAGFVTFDDIEIRNARMDNFNRYPASGVITVEDAAGVTIRNCHIHGWSVANLMPGSPVGAAIAFSENAMDGTIENCTLDATPGADMVGGIYGGKLIRGNAIQNVSTGIVVQSDQEAVEISANYIFNGTHSSDPALNEGGIVVWGPARIHKNVIHGLAPEAAAVFLQSLSFDHTIDQYVYNNLIRNIGPRSAIEINAIGVSQSNQFIHNNTIRTGSTSCVQALAAPFTGANLTVVNNHCISDHTSLPAFCWNSAEGNGNCGPVASVTALTNTLMTTAEANAAGYTIANSMRPTSAAGVTVGVGTNLTAACASAGTALCADRLGVLRPGGSDAWDTGAYFYQSNGPDQAPQITQQPSSRNVADGQTATFSVIATGSGTLAYQWRENGGNIPGATGSSYTTPVVSLLDDETEFDVIVSNASGSLVSATALLAVHPLPGLLVSNVSTVDLGSVYVGISTQVPVTITNNGQLSVTIAGVAVSGAGMQVGGLPVGGVLSPGESTTMYVTFTASAIGAASGSVTITSDASNSLLTISLSGAGIGLPLHGVILSWVPSTSDVIGYRIYRRTGTGAYESMNETAQPTMNFADVAVAAGETYTYVVTAVNFSSIESDFSNGVQVTIPIP